jgi:hypothetical protein
MPPDQSQVPADFSLAKALPEEISGWKKSQDDEVYNRDDIFDYMDGAGEIYLAFDFRFVFVRQYAKADAPSIVVELYQMSSSEDAFGVFTQETDGQEVKVGQAAIYGAGLLRFWKDKIFVRIMADKETPEARDMVMKIGGIIHSAIPEAGPKPGLLRSLPVEGLQPETIRYFHTQISLNTHYYLANVNILNLSPETQAVLARYEKEGGRALLLLVDYPTAEKAYDAYGRFVEMFLLERFVPDGKYPPKKLENEKYAVVGREGRDVIIVLDADKPSIAEWLLKQATQNL